MIGEYDEKDLEGVAKLDPLSLAWMFAVIFIAIDQGQTEYARRAAIRAFKILYHQVLQKHGIEASVPEVQEGG